MLTSDYFSFSKTQCAVFKGTDRAVFLDKREFTGSIYTQIEEAVDFVLRNIRLGATINGLVRKEKYELPPEAIREMIINAHCHRNLLDESCIQVAIYDDRLEVTSPGGLYNGLTYEEVMNGHSKIRNKGIANIFSQMGLVEAWGSGIKRILNAAEEYGLPKPRFQEFDNMFRVELFRTNQVADQANQATNQANQDPEKAEQDIENNVLSEKEKDILNLVRIQPSITQKEMAKVLDWNLASVKYYITKLKEKKYLTRQGSSQKGKWKILKKMQLTLVSIRDKHMKCKEERKMPRKPSLDGKDSSLRIRMSPEQKEKLVSYAERHYQTMSNVIFQALDILYAREEQQNNKE